MIVGQAYTRDWRYVYYGIWTDHPNNFDFQPINFPGAPNEDAEVDGFGWYPVGHRLKPMQGYLNNRWHDPLFWPPKNRVALDRFEPCMDLPGEYVGGPGNGGIGPEGCNAGWILSGYSLSVAGLFNPEVFSFNRETGEYWRAPWGMPSGYRVPSFGHVTYPSLKTHMLEHHWLQNAKVPCNGAFLGCTPYFFNHSYQSVPVTLFYDGSVRLMSVLEAMSSDRRHMRQAGYGLWSRGTPFGENGYFITDGYDFAETSFHILTTEGVRGRDTLGAE